MEQENLQFRIFLDKRNESGIIHSDGTIGTQNDLDFHINIPLYRTYKKFDDYINIDKDPFRTKIERQNFNPFFIELGFFETIKSTGASGLTTDMNVYTVDETIHTKVKLFDLNVNGGT